MKGAYLGPEFGESEILGVVRRYDAKHQYFEDFDELTKVLAEKIADGNVVGWCRRK